ncbi:MAG: hypothetical protein JXA22_05410 [Candidatus Thermoplasmatota archaeon]|nr:hypothetical protein [Candidatus Thermoplasmatota archaeon]
MKWMTITIAAIALLGNFLYIIDPPTMDQDIGNEDDDEQGGDGGELEGSDITSLQVPPMMIGDQARYDYELFAQMFWENKTSGEWGRYTFTGEGEFLQYVDELQEAEDGFHTTHESMELSYETRASFALKIEGSDVDTVTIPGTLELQRSDYTNVFDKHSLKAHNIGKIAVENLGALFGGQGAALADVSYMVDLKTYPDPKDDPVISMDDAIYGMDQVLTLNSRGTYEGEPIWGEEDRQYNWTVEGAYTLLEHDTFKVNVTSDLWDFIYFNRQFYISDDYPFPLKGYTRTNTSYYGSEESFYIILETRQQLKDEAGSMKRGTTEIPWGDPTGHTEYPDLHPAGEYMRWRYVPADGSEVDRSSFSGFTINEAVDHAINTSPELQDFIEEYDMRGEVVVERALWNRSYEDRLERNQTYWWNLTFSYVYEDEELWEYYEENEEWPEWRYTILVARSSEESWNGDKEVSTFIAGDEGDKYFGRRRGGVSEESFNANDEMVTLTHSEKIFRIDDTVKTGAFQDNVLTDDVWFSYSLVGVNEQNNQGLVLIQQITGIKTPTSDNSWSLQKDQVWSSGATLTSSVDANTGQLLSVMTDDGSELASIFM